MVFSWHVIEHVPSLTAYLEKIRDVLRKGGILMIGTENNIDLFYSLKRYAKILCGQVPDLPTSTEHTYGFTAKTMKKILEHFGFEVLKLDIYEDNARNSFLDQAKRGSAGVIYIKKIILQILFNISKIFPTGKKMRVIARKK
ncbi:MAG: hypothetical protein ACD_72C00311G0001 [uncultured bacterium]|nr:MAG: hypothetical protein ACD_72C00311G0001 [uncultured bacterium]